MKSDLNRKDSLIRPINFILPYMYYFKSISLIILISACVMTRTTIAHAQSNDAETEHITATLMDYIEGTANGDHERLRRAFHPDFNLYTVESDTLRIRNGEKYIMGFKPGEKTNRVGRIISMLIPHQLYQLIQGLTS